MPVTRPALREHFALGRVQCCKQRGGPVAPVIVRYAFDIAESHWQQRLRAFQRKYARFGEFGFADVFRIRWQIESSIANLVVAGVRFRLGYPLGEEALNRRVEKLNSILTARVEALAPGWF